MSENLPPLSSSSSTRASDQKKRGELYWAVLFFSPTLWVVPPALVAFSMLRLVLNSIYAQSSTLGWVGTTMLWLGSILIFLWVLVFGIAALFGPVSCSYAFVRRLNANPFVEIVLGVGTWVAILLVNVILIQALRVAACQARLVC